MTNNPTIDGVSRELRALLERVVGKPTGKLNWDALDENRIAAAEELRALLDAPSCKTCQDDGYVGHMLDMHPCPDCAALAPAVERQEPVAYANPKAFENFERLAHLGGLYAHEWMFASPAPELVPLYLEPPHVIALQSTIAQLEDKLNKAIDLDFKRRETISRLEARVQELESGRGEVAGFRYRANGDWEWMDESPFADGRTHYKLGGEELQPLYTTPPAPVAVALPDRKPGYDSEKHPAYLHGWNACIDATAALNGGSHGNTAALNGPAK